MINPPPDSQDMPPLRDFLETGRQGLPPRFPEIAENNRLLRRMLLELQKTHPSIKCYVDVQYTNPSGIIAGPNDRADVRFLYNGKPVKAQYVIVGQSVGRALNVAINEPSFVEPTGTRGNGIWLLTNTSNPQYLEIKAEVEMISIGQLSNAASTLSVARPPVTGITVGAGGGVIPVYAWTIPQADMMEPD